MRCSFTALPALCLVTLAPAALHAQFETGYVRDASAATIPGATVTLTDEQTRATFTAKTNGQGAYEFPTSKSADTLSPRRPTVRSQYHSALHRYGKRPPAR